MEEKEVSITPTVVIGVGEAGTKMGTALYNLVKNEGAEGYFKFVAIDSNEEDLNRNAPSGIQERINLDAPPTDSITEDKKKCKYLYDGVQIERQGTVRRRVVARYLIDNIHNYDAVVWNSLTNIIHNFAEMHQSILNTEPRRSLNIWLLHSLGGGTGSGTFPLITAMIQAIKRSVEQELNVNLFIGGVGCLSSTPEDVKMGPIRGQRTYYANALVAMKEIKKMKESGVLEIPLYARNDEIAIKIEGFPFNKYFFVGINERKMEEVKTEYVESYIMQKNNVVANCIYALHKHMGGLENWHPNEFIGSFGEHEVSVPIKRIKAYVDLKEKKADLEEKLTKVKAEIENIKQKLKSLKSVNDDPEAIPDENKSDIENRVEKEIVDKGMSEKSEGDLKNFVENIKGTYGLEGVRFVVEKLDEKVKEAPQRKKWESKVNELWESHGALKNDNPEIKSIEEKNEKLLEWIRNEIEVYKKWITNPPLFHTSRGLENKERELTNLRKEERELEDLKANYDKVVILKGTVSELRGDVSKDIVDEIAKLGKEKSDKDKEKSDCEDDIRLNDDNISGKKTELSKSKFGRIGYFEMKNLDGFGKREFEAIDSLKSFVDKGFIKENDIGRGLETQMNMARAWSDIAPTQPGVLDLFILGNEENSELANRLPTAATARFTVHNYPITEKYTIKECVYKLGIEIEDIREYRALNGLYEEGELSKTLEEEVGKAFAYPEWFMEDDNVRAVFKKIYDVEGSKSVEMPKKEEKPQPHIATQKITDSGRILVDGSNVAWASKKDGKPNIDNIEIIRSELEKKGYNNPITIVDANLRHIIPKIDKERFEGWINEEKVIQAPAGVKADEELLKFADEDELKIVSNDTFREHENQYPWFKEEGRRVPFNIIENRAVLHFR